MATAAKLDTSAPKGIPDLQSWNESRWSGRGQRFVEEAPRWFEKGDRK